MEIVLIILIVLAFYHYIYENAVAPSIRLKLRYKLFMLRDELRRLKMQKPDVINDALFRQIEGSIHSSVKFLPLFNFVLLYRMIKSYRNDLRLKAEVERKTELIEDCNIEEVKQINKKIADTIAYAIVVNSGGVLPYFFAVIPVILLFSSIQSGAKRILATPTNVLSSNLLEEDLVFAQVG